MSRPLRIEFPNGLYHVTARGNEKRNIFNDRRDFRKLLDIVGIYAERHGIRIYCYVLMNNHYHIMLETPNANLTAFMHNVQSHYTGYYNNRHERIGHLFQGRYKALIVDKDAYFFSLSRYIHLNPVRARITSEPAAWEWSSYCYYITEIPCPVWLIRDEILNRYDTKTMAAMRKYREYVEKELSDNEEMIFRDIKGQLILGGDEFWDRVKKLIVDDDKKIDCEIEQGRTLLRWGDKEANEAIRRIAEKYRVPEEKIVSKGGHKNRAREEAIAEFYNMSCWKQTEIAKKFRISQSAVRKTFLKWGQAEKYEN